jgi:hypothetical protein
LLRGLCHRRSGQISVVVAALFLIKHSRTITINVEV